MGEVMWEFDKEWHQQYDKLLEFERKNGNCVMPRKHEEDKSLGKWIGTQQNFHNKNEICLDRINRLEEIGFVWKVDSIAAEWFQS
jgi:hypothetical protein